MESEDLKSKLKELASFDEVYGFFVANGYDGHKEELKSGLFGNLPAFRPLKDDDLLNVAGGVSGKQVFSACAGFMMLMGFSLSADVRGYAVSASTSHSVVKNLNMEKI